MFIEIDIMGTGKVMVNTTLIISIHEEFAQSCFWKTVIYVSDGRFVESTTRQEEILKLIEDKIR